MKTRLCRFSLLQNPGDYTQLAFSVVLEAQLDWDLGVAFFLTVVHRTVVEVQVRLRVARAPIAICAGARQI